MIIITGSLALNKALGYTVRDSIDIDIIATSDDAESFVASHGQYTSRWNLPDNKRIYIFGTRENPKLIIEAEIAVVGSNQELLLNLVSFDTTEDIVYADLNLLYMLKMSHRFLRNSPHFEKTFNDIQLLRKHNAAIDIKFVSWFTRRINDTYDYNHPKLNQTKKDFFSDDNIIYVYDHDAIHQVIKCGDIPAYMYFKYPDKDVLCSKELFDAADEVIKLNAVLEESYVLALERSQIPHKGAIEPNKSFKIALQKVCSSITSGWFREYAWENYDKVLNMYNDNYASKFWDAVKTGNIKEIRYD